MRLFCARRGVSGVFVVVAALHGGIALAQFDHPRPFQRASDEFLALLMKGAYADLERASANARKNSSTLSDGQPTLAALYGGVSGCVMSGCESRLTDELWKVRERKLEEWRKRYPDSVTAKVALASFPLQYGWFARGGGYSSTVSNEGYALFSERLQRAHRELEGLDEAAKHDPGWFHAMLDVAHLEGWPKARFDALYQEAARAHPTYLQIHFSGATYYSPRWHGSWPELRRFIEGAVELTRSQLGESLYARLNWGPLTREMFREDQADWPRMKAGFESLVKSYPDPWNVNNYAMIACMARDWPTVSRLAATIGDKPVAAAWLGSVRVYESCRSQAEGSRQGSPRNEGNPNR